MAINSPFKAPQELPANPTIREYLGLNPVNPYTNSKATELQCADPSLLMGLELEIENVPNWEDMGVAGVTSVEDGSLRNNGREFLTKPATFSVAYNILHRFFEKNKLTADNYSERTSVHVHANCQDLTKEQLAAVCMLYQVFEKLFYAFIGEERDRNIFCIPWDQTLITYSTIDAVLGAKGIHSLKSWQKYTGLNLLPLFSLGTIEFRHMAGTNDLEKIAVWMNLIGSLFAYARKHPINDIKDTLVNLNSTSAYEDTTHRVFTFWTKHLLDVPGYRPFLEEGVLNMKYSLLRNTGNNQGVDLDALIRQQRELERNAILRQAEIQDRAVREAQAQAGGTVRVDMPLAGAQVGVGEWRAVPRDAPDPWPRAFGFANNNNAVPAAPARPRERTVEIRTGRTRRRPQLGDPYVPRPAELPADLPETFFDDLEDNA